MAQPIGMVCVEIIGADDLPAMDLNGKADPYFVLNYGGEMMMTSAIKKETRAPRWNEKTRIIMMSDDSDFTMNVKVWDWDKLTQDDYIGEVDIPLKALAGRKGPMSSSHVLTDNTGKKSKTRGILHVTLQFLDPEEVHHQFWITLVRHFDADQNGFINETEMLALVSALHPSLVDEKIIELYEKAKKNRDDNEVTYEQVVDVLSHDAELQAELKGHDPHFIWHVYAQTDEYHTISNLVLNKNLVHKEAVTASKPNHKSIIVFNLYTGAKEEEKIPHYLEVAMRLMYSTSTGRSAVENNHIKKLLSHLSKSQGKKYDDPKSKKDIEPFIKFHGLNVEENLLPLDSYPNFNHFFFRKLKSTARPIADTDNSTVAVSPADCRMHVFATIDDATRLWVKGHNFSVENLILDRDEAKKYEGGSMVIARLAPQDYHRFHIPVNGKIGPTRPINGPLFTVNPIAINQTVDVFTENKRYVTSIESPEFGKVLYVSIGATMVGSVNFTSTEGSTCKKGDEHGYFAFGGSTVIVLFQPNKIEFRNILLVNSQQPIETLVKMGERIGQAK
eukprot:TRINITY_DN4132_c0_g1_i1.p1 TRINITY_DN4132_c0_g1~~TRINITY_DN4132_c0_g1_i1.p1  ORF type:complete len:559 (+),score=113.13 TRINITY_DN4132_c0_g1_i1:53-1729(+)